MDAIEFLKERHRMCKAIGACNNCILYYMRGYGNINCADFTVGFPEKVIPIVETWVKSNPKHTYKDELLSKFPNVILTASGYPVICPGTIFGDSHNVNCGMISCVNCWNREYKK